MTTTAENKWMGKNAKPARPGWQYVRYPNGHVGCSYYDDSKDSWEIVTHIKGQLTFVPDNSFLEWLFVPNVSDAQHS